MRLGWRSAYNRVVSEEIIDGVRVYHPRYFMIPKVAMVLHGLLMFLNVFFFVKQIQRRFDFDIIDAHYVYPDGFAAVLLGRCFQRPVVVSARGSDINQFSQFPLIRRLLQYTLKKADKTIGVCQALKNAMIVLGTPAEKICVVPNGVDMDKFYRFPKEEARKRLGLPLDRKIILSVGGLIPRKGFDLLIRAVNLLMRRCDGRNLYLVIVGEGPSRKDLEILTSSLGRSSDVQFTGAVPHQELYLWYSAADLFCLASSREGWPNVILEAVACGTPVVASDVWGIPEVIGSGQVGFLTKRTEYAIAEGVLVAFRKEWCVDDLQQYAGKHSWERTAQAVRDVLQSVVNVKKVCRTEIPPERESREGR